MGMMYYKLFDLLSRKGLKKTDLLKNKIISSPTLAKLSKGETVTTEILSNICKALNCQPGDIMEYISDNETDVPNIMDTKKLQKSSIAESQTVHQEPPEPESEAPHIPQKKPERQFKPFTESDAEKIDIARLPKDIKYQMDIAEVYGMDILASLLDKARMKAVEATTTKQSYNYS